MGIHFVISVCTYVSVAGAHVLKPETNLNHVFFSKIVKQKPVHVCCMRSKSGCMSISTSVFPFPNFLSILRSIPRTLGVTQSSANLQHLVQTKTLVMRLLLLSRILCVDLRYKFRLAKSE